MTRRRIRRERDVLWAKQIENDRAQRDPFGNMRREDLW